MKMASNYENGLHVVKKDVHSRKKGELFRSVT